MGSEVLASVSDPFSQNDGGNQCRDTGINMHHRAAGEVQDTCIAEKAAAPHPITDWRIHQDGPRTEKQEQGGKFHALCDRTRDKGSRDDRERHPERHEYRFWN